MPEVLEIIKLGPNAVISGLLIGVLYFVLVRHSKSTDRLVDALERHSERFEEAIDINTCVLIGVQQQLLAHDLTVSGLNPSTGATIDERTNRAFLKYSDVMRQFDDARALLLARHNRPTAPAPRTVA